MGKQAEIPLDLVPAKFVALARAKFASLTAKGFRDVELVDHAIPHDRGWSFTVRHLVTGGEVGIEVDDVEMFALWQGETYIPEISDFAQPGFEPVLTFRPAAGQ